MGFPHPRASSRWEHGGGGGVPASVVFTTEAGGGRLCAGTTEAGRTVGGWEQRRRGRGSRIRLHGGELSVEQRMGGRLCAGTTGGGSRIRLQDGEQRRRGWDGSRIRKDNGWASGNGGRGMRGPRIRKDNGWGRGREDGGRVALRLGEGWVPAYARTTDGEREGGRWAGGVAAGGGMGPRIREDNGWGRGRGGGWAGGVAGGAAFEYNGLKYPQIPVV